MQALTLDRARCTLASLLDALADRVPWHTRSARHPIVHYRAERESMAYLQSRGEVLRLGLLVAAGVPLLPPCGAGGPPAAPPAALSRAAAPVTAAAATSAAAPTTAAAATTQAATSSAAATQTAAA